MSTVSGMLHSPLKVGHEFYVSTTELRVDAENARLTGVMQVFPDDWERAMNAILEASGERYIRLSGEEKDSLHAWELTRTFIVKAPEKLTLSYVGSETTAEFVRLYFTLDHLEVSHESPWTFHVWTLADIFPSQENIITLYDLDGSRNTNSCREGNDYILNL